MMKISLSILLISLLTLSSFSQVSMPDSTLLFLKSNLHSTNTPPLKPSNSFTKSIMTEIWSDDFSTPSNWNIAHNDSTCSLDWEIGIGLSNGGTFPIDNIYSSTAENGFAMIDSDQYGEETGGEDMENSWFTNSIPIDLSDISNAILEFETYYYKWSNEECFVVISTNNTDWPNLSPDFEADSNANVFRVWPDMEVQEPVNNPTLKQINISEVAGNQSAVWIRFNWTGTYGYSWFIDDVKIFEQTANDMRMEYGFFSHVNSDINYSRIPSSQFNDKMYFSSLSSNFGYENQTEVIITLDFKDENSTLLFTDTSNVKALLTSGSNYSFNTNEDSLYLSEGVYKADFLVTSVEEVDGDEFYNNSIQSIGEITNNLFSIDGIGVIDQPSILSIGTNSFADAADESYLMSQYYLSRDSNFVHGIEVLLSSSTIAGGSIIGHIFYANDVLNQDLSSPIFSSEEIIISQENVNDGFFRIYFDNTDSLEANNYMAAIEMYSNDNTNVISILNDISFLQPNDASVMFIDGYINPYPNSAAIRLLLSPDNSTSILEFENSALLFQNTPNPASDNTTIEFSLKKDKNITLRITDSMGKLIIDKTLGLLSPGKHKVNVNVSSFKAGVYHYSILTQKNIVSKSMLVIK